MKGRKSETNRIFSFCMRIAACHASVITLTALLQFPAFFYACSPVRESAPAHNDGQIYIQWTKNPIQDSVDLFFFDTTGVQLLDAYQKVVPIEGQPTAGLSRSGPRRLVALARVPSGPGGWYGVRGYADLCKTSFLLEQDSPLQPLLYGEARTEGGTSMDVQLPLQPLLTHIHLRSVSCDFGTLPYAGQTFFNSWLFLSYAGAECRPLGAGDPPEPLSWLNAGALDSVSARRLPHPEMVWQTGCGEIGPKRIYPERDFYCYPGLRTCLVLEGRVGADVCYYPVPLRGLRPGKTYRLDLTLQRKGAPDPDMPVESGTVIVDCFTVPWEQETPRTIYL